MPNICGTKLFLLDFLSRATFQLLHLGFASSQGREVPQGFSAKNWRHKFLPNTIYTTDISEHKKQNSLQQGENCIFNKYIKLFHYIFYDNLFLICYHKLIILKFCYTCCLIYMCPNLSGSHLEKCNTFNLSLQYNTELLI